MDEYLSYSVLKERGLIFVDRYVPREVCLYLISMTIEENLFSGGKIQHHYFVMLNGHNLLMFNSVTGGLFDDTEIHKRSESIMLGDGMYYKWLPQCQAFIEVHSQLNTMSPMKIAEKAFEIATGKLVIEKPEVLVLPEGLI